MLKDLTTAQASLAELMSEISERCYSTGWMRHLEYVLWDAMLQGARKYGHDFVTPEDATNLKKLAEAAKCWILFDDTTEETAIELSVWQELYRREVERNPDLLNG